MLPVERAIKGGEFNQETKDFIEHLFKLGRCI